MTEEIRLKKAIGRPRLHWDGKRPLGEIRYYPAQAIASYGPSTDGWVNRLYWGDNLQVMAHLLGDRTVRGQIDLVYIDPPFNSDADYYRKYKFGGVEVHSDPTLIEDKMYTDIAEPERYLQMMYERLILIRELLSPQGSIFLHCDTHRSHHLRCLLDEVFGEENFRNEIVREKQRGGKHHVKRSLGSIHDTIFHYSKTDDFIWNEYRRDVPERVLMERYPYEDEIGRYALADCTNFNVVRPNLTYEFLGFHRTWKWTKEEMERKFQEGEVVQLAPGNIPRRKVRPNPEGDKLQSIWYDVPDTLREADYPTEKSERLLERIVALASVPGSIVADFFAGSGTTCDVAQAMGRRWIGAELNRPALTSAVRRILCTIAEQGKGSLQGTLDLVGDEKVAPASVTFTVATVNTYDLFSNPEEGRRVLLDMFGIQPTSRQFFHGMRDQETLVYIVDPNRICTAHDIQAVFDELDKADQYPPELDVEVLCVGVEPSVAMAISEYQKVTGRKIRVRNVLHERDDIVLRRPPEAVVEATRVEDFVQVEIKSFYPHTLLDKIRAAGGTPPEDWRQLVAEVHCGHEVGPDDEPQFVYHDMPARGTVVGSYRIKGIQTDRVFLNIVDRTGDECIVTVEVK